MDACESRIFAALLSDGTALHVDTSCRIRAVYHPVLLAAWLDEPAPLLTAGSDAQEILQRLVPSAVPALRQLLDDTGVAGEALQDLGIFATVHGGHGMPPRHLSLSAQRLGPAEAGVLLLLRDVTATAELQLATARAQAAADTTLALLRAAPDAMRLFLDAAMASVSALRATLRMTARTDDALRDKLARLQAGARQLQQEALALHLMSMHEACGTLAETVAQLQANAAISGNAVLPLAALVDRIAQAIGNAWRIEEQRYSPAPAARNPQPSRTRARASANWPQASERRWNHFLRRRGEEIGVLARLAMSGAALVPSAIRRDIDEILQHLLRNALEHGVETPEQRLAADKPAAGQITVTFENHGSTELRLVVRDDGRGFDLQRIGQAALKCGLLSEESLLEKDAGDLVGFIFKPGFTTDGLDEGDRHGRGMIFLRNAVTRLNGQVSIATKAGRYTQFNLQLPVGASLQASRTPAYV